MAQTFLSSVLGLKISQGGIQKVLDRCSQAITPHYRAIERCTRLAPRNHIDETPWLRKGALHWLWVMVNPQSALFLIHPNRSTQAFRQLVSSWDGTLISDNYGVYQKWPRRQTCLGPSYPNGQRTGRAPRSSNATVRTMGNKRAAVALQLAKTSTVTWPMAYLLCPILSTRRTVS